MSIVVYEDQIVRANLAPDAATSGHIILEPQRAAVKLSDLSPDESSHIFVVASYTAAILFQGLKAEGTNIIINEEEERLTVHILARRADDGLSFTWQPMKVDDSEMNESAEKIKDKTFFLGKKKSDAHTEAQNAEPKALPKKETKPEKKESRDADPPPDAVADAEAEENYLIKQLIRIP